jgi:hypothetical protein
MKATFGDSTALSAARDALDLYGARYQRVVRFGYVEFPGTESCDGQSTCCASLISLPSDNFQAFEVALHACEQDPPYCVPGGSQRATAAAVNSAAAQLLRNVSQDRRYLVLITNGQPECGSGSTNLCTEVQMTVNDLSRAGIATMVVLPVAGQLDDMTRSCLQGIALQGGANVSPYYYSASTPAALTDTLGQLTGSIATDACQVDVKTQTQLRPDNVAVFWKTALVPYGHSDGWEIRSNGSVIQLNGSACARLISGDPQADLRIQTNCSTLGPR